MIRTYLPSHSWEDDEECEVERPEDDAKGDGGNVPDDGRAVGMGVERGPSILTE